MEIQGRVENGVVVFVGAVPLPDGAAVSVVYPVPSRAQPPGRAEPIVEKRRIELPLVHCEQPGSVHLMSERIGEILDAEDAASRH